MNLPPLVLRCNDFRSFGLWLSKPAGKRTASVVRQALIWMEHVALVMRTRGRCRIAATCRTLVYLHRILAWPEADSQSDSEGSYEGLSTPQRLRPCDEPCVKRRKQCRPSRALQCVVCFHSQFQLKLLFRVPFFIPTTNYSTVWLRLLM